jgi:hypothetical protein
MLSTEIDFSADTIDVRDLIARFEELSQQKEFENDLEVSDLIVEVEMIHDILEELKGCGGDEQWQGDWYPLLLIRDSYFTDYAREMIDDCGELPRDLPHYIAIDWEETAGNILVDYSSIDIDGTTYYFR